MHTRTKWMLIALAAALSLAAAVGNASARRIEFSETHFLVLIRELTFAGNPERPPVICSVNLEGSFHSRTISKVSGQLLGYITEAAFHHPCRERDAWMLNGVEVLPGGRTASNTLPWHIQYRSFIGTLPNISGIGIQFTRGGFLVETFMFSCLYEITQAKPLTATLEVEPGGAVTSLHLSERDLIPLKEGGFLCFREIVVPGFDQIGTQGAWGTITVRLVA